MNNLIQIGKNTITLKGYKTVAYMSEETLCFTATIIFNGKEVADISNEGHGGSDNIYPIDKTAYAIFEEFVKTLPAKDFNWGSQYRKFMDVESIVSVICDKIEEEKADKKNLNKLKKQMKEKLCVLLKGEDLKNGWSVINLDKINPANQLLRVRQKYEGITILNELSDSDLVLLIQKAK